MAPDYTWEDPDLTAGKIRSIDQISNTFNKGTWKFTYNFAKTVKIYAGIEILAFVCILVLLIAFVLMVNADVVKFVVYPLETMFEKVQRLSRNPMSVIKSMIEEDLKPKKEGSKEIHMIDKSVTKVAYLLVIGYGEAGTGIIIKNMNRSGTRVDIPGEKVIGIYGFCDIRNFTDATEVLQTKVMTFVNRIASIVHTNVVKFGGSPNKNIGDAFLFVWKLASLSEEPGFFA